MPNFQDLAGRIAEHVKHELREELRHRGHETGGGDAAQAESLRRIEQLLREGFARGETILMDTKETLDRFVRESGESHAAIADFLATVQTAVDTLSTLPDRVKAAVAEALAQNDLSPLNALSDGMDADQATLAAAKTALQSALDAANAPPPAPPPPTETETTPATGETTFAGDNS